MALFSIPHISLKGLSAVVPKKEISNWDYDWISEQERAALVKTTGIAKRRVVEAGGCTSDLCEVAARSLLKALAWDPQEVDLLVLVTQTPDYYLPATAVILQHKLGLSKKCLAFDINLGCSGYVYGLSIVGNMLQSGHLKKALLLVGDVSSISTSYKDKSAYPLFGDAGTATAIAYDPNAKNLSFNLQSDGEGYDAIIIEDGCARNYQQTDALDPIEFSPKIIRNKSQLALKGIDIFNFALREVAPNIRTLLVETQQSVEDFDYAIFHQANLLINESIRKKLKLTKEQVPISLREFGNTSSASIPLTMVTQMREQLSQKNLQLLLSGFGVGLSWGSVSLTTSPMTCLPLIEI